MLSLHRLGSMPENQERERENAKLTYIEQHTNRATALELTWCVEHLHFQHHLDGFRVEVRKCVFFMCSNEFLANISFSQELLYDRVVELKIKETEEGVHLVRSNRRAGRFATNLRQILGDDGFDRVLAELTALH